MIQIALSAAILMSAVPSASTLPKKPRSLGAALKAIRPQVEESIGREQLSEATDGSRLTIVALKEERLVEVWKSRLGENGGEKKILTMPFTGFSGKLGPKLREGDRQIPEGIYKVSTLNPNSSYHLSFQINYPTSDEKKRAVAEGRRNPGGLIFFHGSHQTIGCIPVGDANIEVLFTLVAMNKPENCLVIIAPRDFRKGLPAPEIVDVSWSEELYESLEKALRPYTETEMQIR